MAANSIMQSWTEIAGGRYATALIDFSGESAKGTDITAEEVFSLNPDAVIIGGTEDRHPDRNYRNLLQAQERGLSHRYGCDGAAANRPFEGLAEEGYAIMMTTQTPDHAIILGDKVAVLDREGSLKTGTAPEMMNGQLLSALYGMQNSRLLYSPMKMELNVVEIKILMCSEAAIFRRPCFGYDSGIDDPQPDQHSHDR